MTVKATNNGVEIKALKRFEGMEGWTYQGNLYVENKKVAAWSQDSHGGIVDWLTMEPGFSEDKLRSIFADVDSNLGLELAMNELVVLKDRLKVYKKAKKDGYRGIFVLCGEFWEKIWLIPAGNTQTPEQLKEELLPQCKENFKRNSDPTPYLYTKDEDFCIGKPITLDDIRC